MHRFTRQTLVLSFLFVGLFSAILGGVIALALFREDPQVVVREVRVEVEPSEPPLSPSRENVLLLAERYVEIAGVEEDWTVSLVEEIGAMVCNDGYSGAQVMQEIGPDIGVNQIDLDAFVKEVSATCPDAT